MSYLSGGISLGRRTLVVRRVVIAKYRWGSKRIDIQVWNIVIELPKYSYKLGEKYTSG